jgi:hypothetical protein
MTNLIFDKQNERFILLFALYKKSNAQTEMSFNIRDLASQHGMGYHSFRSAYDYLIAEELIQPKYYTGNSDTQDGYFHASITIKGINAIEEVFKNMHKESTYFPPYHKMVN